MFKITKTFGHSEGLSCCFRQWKAESHCKYLHGYALQVSMIFASDNLDVRNWVIDYGSFKEVKDFLHRWFDHTTILADDDPDLTVFKVLSDRKLIQLRTLPKVSTEMFAEFIFTNVNTLIVAPAQIGVTLESVRVSEHSGNSAMYGK